MTYGGLTFVLTAIMTKQKDEVHPRGDDYCNAIS